MLVESRFMIPKWVHGLNSVANYLRFGRCRSWCARWLMHPQLRVGGTWCFHHLTAVWLPSIVMFDMVSVELDYTMRLEVLRLTSKFESEWTIRANLVLRICSSHKTRYCSRCYMTRRIMNWISDILSKTWPATTVISSPTHHTINTKYIKWLKMM